MKHTNPMALAQWHSDSTLPDLAEIVETFELIDDWEERYRYVIELGKGLAHFDDSERSDENLVRGCQSQVWLQTALLPGTDQLTLAIDSDAHIVRGLAAILVASLQGQTLEQVRQADPEAQFERLGLLGHLSPSRGNGLRAMIARIQQSAKIAGDAAQADTA